MCNVPTTSWSNSFTNTLSKWWVFLQRVERPKTTTTTSPWPTRPTSTCSRQTRRFSIPSSSNWHFYFVGVCWCSLQSRRFSISRWWCIITQFHISISEEVDFPFHHHPISHFTFRGSWCSRKHWSAILWTSPFGSLATMPPLLWDRLSSPSTIGVS